MSEKKKNFVGKFAGKGYYIALILCAVAIGISGYLYYQNANADNPSLENPNATVDALDMPVTTAAVTSELPQWAALAVAAMAESGITLENAPMTRAQVANVLYQASLLAEDAPGMRVFARQ